MNPNGFFWSRTTVVPRPWLDLAFFLNLGGLSLCAKINSAGIGLIGLGHRWISNVLSWQCWIHESNYVNTLILGSAREVPWTWQSPHAESWVCLLLFLIVSTEFDAPTSFAISLVNWEKEVCKASTCTSKIPRGSCLWFWWLWLTRA